MKDRENRIKTIAINRETLEIMLLRWFMTGAIWTAEPKGYGIQEAAEPLPPDAEVVGSGFDHYSNCFVLGIYSASYEVVPLGDHPPIMKTIIRAISNYTPKELEELRAKFEETHKVVPSGIEKLMSKISI